MAPVSTNHERHSREEEAAEPAAKAAGRFFPSKSGAIAPEPFKELDPRDEFSAHCGGPRAGADYELDPEVTFVQEVHSRRPCINSRESRPSLQSEHCLMGREGSVADIHDPSVQRNP